MFESLRHASFTNLGNIYLWPGRFVKLSALEYLGVMAAGTMWLLFAGYVAWRILRGRRGSDACRLALAGAVLFVMTGSYVTLVYPPTTDEPHYLMIADSLVSDGDLELSGNYTEGTYKKFYPSASLDPHTVITRDGRMHSQHTAGLPLLIAPAYALAGRWGITLLLAAATAGLLVVMHRLCLTAGASGWAALVTCAAAGATAPLLFASTLVFTETAAAAFVGLALCGISSAPCVAVCAALLPWLHPRFALLSAGLLALNLVETSRKGRWHAAGTGLLICSASAGLFLCVYHGPAMTAVLNVLTEKYPARLEDLASGPLLAVSFGNPVIAALGKLLDRDFGLLPFSPWYVMLVPGIAVAAGRRNPAGRRFLAGGAAYLVLTLLFRNWGGSAYPGRTLVPLLPFAAPYLAFGTAWALEHQLPRRVFAFLLAVSLGTSWALTVCPVLRYTSGREWMAARLGKVWLAAPFAWFPSFKVAYSPLSSTGILLVAAVLIAVVLFAKSSVEAWRRKK